MKKKYFIVTLMLCLFLGMSTVGADPVSTYESYSAGDIITVQVDDTNSYNFYVIKDSGDSDSEVTALLYTESAATYNYADATTQIQNYNNAWKNTNEVRFPTLKELLGLDVTQSITAGKFTSPTYLIPGSGYWLEEIAMDKAHEVTPWHWEINHDAWDTSIGSYSISPDDTTNSIRPVITVSKDYVTRFVVNNIQTPTENDGATVITNVPNTFANSSIIMTGVAVVMVLLGVCVICSNKALKKNK